MPELLEQLADIALRVRARRPLIHYMPNWVTANDAANALLAFGASPVMAVAHEEVADIRGEALALNFGTPTSERIEALSVAGRAATARHVPIVLDPVGVGATPFRFGHVQSLLATLPITILRLNAGEAAALLGQQDTAQGVDAGVADHDRAALARELARRYATVAAVSGAMDAVSDGTRTITIANGHPLLTHLTGTGCMLTGVVAACAAVETDPLLAAGAALLAFGVAGERAAAMSQGPGSLRVVLMDELYQLDREMLLEYGQVRLHED